MLIKEIGSSLIEHLGHPPTESQVRLMAKMAEFLSDFHKHQIFLVKGYAGTGKTTSVRSIIETLGRYKQKAILLAPTGRAAKVLANYTGQQAFTIHRKIYRQKTSGSAAGSFTLNFNKHKDTLFIVDEASMIANQSNEGGIFGSGRLLDDLIEFVFAGEGCKLILLGDTAQLPPVGYAESPALDKEILKNYLLEVDEIELTDVIRQQIDSGILNNATRLRSAIPLEAADVPTFQTEDFSDVVRLSGEDLIESIAGSYDRFGMEETMIVCRSNKRANIYNQGIRNKILCREEELSPGDLLMVVKNNYFWLQEQAENSFIANGDMIMIKRILKYTERYGFRFADVIVSFPDYDFESVELKIIMDTLSIEGPSLSYAQNESFFRQISEDYAHYGKKAIIYKKIKEDPFFNALQVKFGYAITCHKAQGGQWKHVYLDQGFLPDDQLSTEHVRWLYTGLTRASEKLFFVNFHSKFFKESQTTM
jgi:exodeoxyribonuclease V